MRETRCVVTPIPRVTSPSRAYELTDPAPTKKAPDVPLTLAGGLVTHRIQQEFPVRSVDDAGTSLAGKVVEPGDKTVVMSWK